MDYTKIVKQSKKEGYKKDNIRYNVTCRKGCSQKRIKWNENFLFKDI